MPSRDEGGSNTFILCNYPWQWLSFFLLVLYCNAYTTRQRKQHRALWKHLFFPFCKSFVIRGSIRQRKQHRALYLFFFSAKFSLQEEDQATQTAQSTLEIFILFFLHKFYYKRKHQGTQATIVTEDRVWKCQRSSL